MTSEQKLPDWFPHNPPIYDIDKSYAENALNGPFFNGEIPERNMPDESEWIDFLGHKVASPLGVPAGPLLNSNWIELAGKLGFDLPVYKTIRSSAHPGHPLPNMLHVDTGGPVIVSNREMTALKAERSSSLEQLALTNSFGMPSKSQDFLLEDIARANSVLSKGQVLIVSVVGSQSPEKDFIEDFKDAALLAKEAGAKIIEANFSCPNVEKQHGQLYSNPNEVYRLGKALVDAIAPLPLIIKVGTFIDIQQLKEMLISAARAGVRGISGLNSVSMRVIDTDGNSPLGDNRQTSGICGGVIRHAALDFIKKTAIIIREEQLDLTLIGVGGIAKAHHFDQFLEQGADFAMSATGMMWDPYLAMRYHLTKSKELV